MDDLRIGAIVHSARPGFCLPAIVTAIDADDTDHVSLTTFTTFRGAAAVWADEHYDRGRLPGTWHPLEDCDR